MEAGKSPAERISPFGQKRDMLDGKAKLLGYIVEKTEHSGSVTKFNLNDGPADYAAIKHALGKARIAAADNSIPSSKSHEEGCRRRVRRTYPFSLRGRSIRSSR
jgi:hypothetical protein